MKIAFLVANLGCGGVERTVSYLSKYFANQGHSTSIICISDEQFYEIDESVNLIKLNITSNSCGRIERYKKILLRITKINASLKKIKPDCVVCLDAEMLRFIRFRHKMKKFKLITSERTNPMMNSEKQRKSKYRCYRSSDGIVFQTERAKLCFPPDISEKGVVIPNAVGNEFVFSAIQPQSRRKTITAAGRLTKQKDYPTLIKAFSLLHKKHPDYLLEIYGNGEDAEELKQMVHELSLSEFVIFKGSVKDAILHIASSACYVMSSLYEGMPNALMEALAVGVPCVSTDCPFGPRELIRNNENGILVEVGDENALSDAMCRMIEDPDFAQKCATESKKILIEQNIDAISQKYLDYISCVVNQ